jgi:hypothetical protein
MGRVATGLSVSLDGFIAVPRCAHAGGRVSRDVQGNTQGDVADSWCSTSPSAPSR